jgi:hypothetical protein
MLKAFGKFKDQNLIVSYKSSLKSDDLRKMLIADFLVKCA